MSMQSPALLPELQKLPAVQDAQDLDLSDTVTRLRAMDKDHFAIEVAEIVETTLEGMFDSRNVPDTLTEAHNLSFPNYDRSLNDHYRELQERGPEAVGGLVNNLKGKVAELETVALAEERFSGYTFNLAENPNEQGWDLHGVGPEGSPDIYVQVKTRVADNASEVIDRMQESPDFVFALNQELYDKVLESNPDFADRMIETRRSNLEYTEGTEGGLELLASNAGFDVPDSIGEMLPYVGEIILGIRLVMDVISTERDFRDVELDDRARVHVLKALVLMSRFGVTTVFTTAGGAAGSAAGTALFPGVGTTIGGIAGSIGGAGTAIFLNRRLQPQMMEVSMGIAGVDEDDMFYFRNKKVIDGIGASLADTRVA